uniref:Uncharacterized protein n=1 Tax=Glossina austeni TaxID=7395 RepID=A0A1A9UH44_GLOAU
MRYHAISHLTADRNIIVRLSLNSLFSTLKSEPIVRMTAKEFMFGYNTKLTSLGNTFLPNWIYFDKVGLIDRMYDFDSDYETFYTGRNDPSLSGLYATYRGNTDLPNWPEKHCSNIETASDGSKFRSFIKPNDTLKFFRKSMCRPIHLVRADTDIVTKCGLEGYRYRFEDNAFDNGRYNMKNKCFCRKDYWTTHIHTDLYLKGHNCLRNSLYNNNNEKRQQLKSSLCHSSLRTVTNSIEYFITILEIMAK